MINLGMKRSEDAPLQAHVTNLDASPFLGRLALLRIHNGTLRRGQAVAWARHDGTLSAEKEVQANCVGLIVMQNRVVYTVCQKPTIRLKQNETEEEYNPCGRCFWAAR